MRLAVNLLSVLFLATLSIPGQEYTVTATPAPNRGGAFDTWCPPNGNSATGGKSPLDATKGDKVADKLYYMGESKFVRKEANGDEKNVIVRTWCKAGDPTDRGAGMVPRFTFNDFFTYEILTSSNGVETQRIPPGTPC